MDLIEKNLLFKLHKTFRYILMYGISRTIVKIKPEISYEKEVS